jgi:dTDP-glucose 4,6-dehydratase/UDP-glucose 4-epimerase
MKTILILGSGGFIGHHTVMRFDQEPGFQTWRADLTPAGDQERYFQIDPEQPDFERMFRTVPFDFCINCTGAANVSDSLTDPVRDFRLNTFNVLQILDAIRKHSPRTRFLNLSSAAVYGNPERLPVSESQASRPVSPYGIHKHMAEQICSEYWRFFGVGTCSVRIFSAYGPGLKKQLLWDLSRKAKAGSPVALSGTGRETRDFVFIDDIVEAFLVVTNRARFEGEALNLASGTATSIENLATELLGQLGYTGSIVFDGTARAGDPLHWQADISGLQSLGFHPQFSLSQGISECVPWLKEQL